MKRNNNPIIVIAIGIQIGDKTHHQDHEITLHSLRTINAIVRRVGKLPIWIEIFALSLILSSTFNCKIPNLII